MCFPAHSYAFGQENLILRSANLYVKDSQNLFLACLSFPETKTSGAQHMQPQGFSLSLFMTNVLPVLEVLNCCPSLPLLEYPERICRYFKNTAEMKSLTIEP